MNWPHLSAFLWLNWRLRINQLTRGKAGLLNTVLLAFFAVSLAIGSTLLFVCCFLAGLFALSGVKPESIPVVLLIIWDVGVLGFLFSWSTGMLTDLQRSEALSLEKFLHLPVSLSGVFLLNYLSSLMSVTLAGFLPIMVGFSLGLVFSVGPGMIAILPLVASFVLMITALSYQFQGWLALLMVNKRRRRTIIAVATMTFVLVFQLPNLINIYQPWKKGLSWTPEERKETLELAKYAAEIGNIVLPPGWLPLGAMSAAQGNFLIPLLGTLGMTLIGCASLWRAYRTTLRMYTGQLTGERKAIAHAVPSSAKSSLPGIAQPAYFLEKKIPWISEYAAIIALAGLRSLMRASEVKMLLMTPLLMGVILGGVFFNLAGEDIAQPLRPVIAFGAMAMNLFALIQLVGNQFGYDRSGFRVFVLSPAPRREILLGKNLAVAPIALVLLGFMAILVAIFLPMRFDHVMALLPQMISIYFLFCMVANWMAIFAPMPVASGSLKAVYPKPLMVLMQMAFLMSLPLAISPVLVPVGIEAALNAVGWLEDAPVHLVLSALLCGAILYSYRHVLIWQGNVFQRREMKILETVITRGD